MSAFADSSKTLLASLECPEGHIEFFLGAVSTAGQQRIDFLYTLLETCNFCAAIPFEKDFPPRLSK
jgi:hypothetical protein